MSSLCANEVEKNTPEKNDPAAKEIKNHNVVIDEVNKITLPEDPCQRVATKAIRGDFGDLPNWKRCAYEHILRNGIKCIGFAKVTSYGPWEPAYMSGGSVTASGSRVHLRGCASNPEIKFGTLIWTPYGLRYVTDRGGWVKVGYASVYGEQKKVTSNKESANFDYYTKQEWDTLRNAPYAIVKANGDRSVWFVKPPKRKRR